MAETAEKTNEQILEDWDAEQAERRATLDPELRGEWDISAAVLRAELEQELREADDAAAEFGACAVDEGGVVRCPPVEFAAGKPATVRRDVVLYRVGSESWRGATV